MKITSQDNHPSAKEITYENQPHVAIQILLRMSADILFQ